MGLGVTVGPSTEGNETDIGVKFSFLILSFIRHTCCVQDMLGVVNIQGSLYYDHSAQ